MLPNRRSCILNQHKVCVHACDCVQPLKGLLIKEEKKPKQRTKKDQKCVQTEIGRIANKVDFPESSLFIGEKQTKRSAASVPSQSKVRQLSHQ